MTTPSRIEEKSALAENSLCSSAFLGWPKGFISEYMCGCQKALAGRPSVCNQYFSDERRAERTGLLCFRRGRTKHLQNLHKSNVCNWAQRNMSVGASPHVRGLNYFTSCASPFLSCLASRGASASRVQCIGPAFVSPELVARLCWCMYVELGRVLAVL